MDGTYAIKMMQKSYQPYKKKKGHVTAWKTREAPSDLNKWTCQEKNYRVYILSANQEKLPTEANAPQRFAEESKAFVKRKKYIKE